MSFNFHFYGFKLGEGKGGQHLQAVRLRVHYSINFSNQSSGTNDIQETTCNSTEKNAAILHLAKIMQITAIHLEEEFSKALMLKET